ncbi:glycine oxidase ThiO [Methylobacter sp. S3L5C]|uniref:glycine oxidase ThiO n=1 Tax=Methylobacter sp. S3L5C TaxID=2839024 RepID=UPI001FACCCE4|nr:glycine oxidase ThiO [Methylobacter sp. S3L5C]UOA09234.1 glycine oxidase ThiO [Methylobacter sp. S3L5C]
MTKTTDITIIGGGVIGLLTAREFFNAGATVTVIEKNLLGQESSWAGGGILLPLCPWRQDDAITRLAIQSHSLYPDLSAQLLNDTRLDPEWTPCGLLITKNPDITAALNWCNTNNIEFEIPGAGFFNELDTTPDNPLFLPKIAQIRNPRLIKSLKQDLTNKGVTLLEHCELTGITLTQDRITKIHTTTGQLTVNQLVISAGAWTGQLFQQLFPDMMRNAPKIAPVKGQMLIFNAQPETLRAMVLDGDKYLIPRRDGKILAGSTVEHDNFNKSTTTAARDRLTEFALTLLPALKKAPLIHHWAGLRPGTEYGVPYIDKHPEICNLSINAGHFRNGLVMGPASAQLIVDLILNRPTAIAPEPYKLSRLVD